MTTRRFTRAAFLGLALGAALLTAACSRPYKEPQFDAGGPPVPATDASVSFQGVAAKLKPKKTIGVFWTHGMCDHDDRWSLASAALLKSALSATVGDDAAVPEGGGSTSYTTRLKTTKGDVLATFYVWSPISQTMKKRLRFDSLPARGGSFPYDRAAINDFLKRKLMNECLADAVVISGANGEKIAQDTRAVLCRFLGGTLAPPTECVLSSAEDTMVGRILIAESLGSKILADAIANLTPAAGQEKLFKARRESISTIFLLANQIPILDLADIDTTGVSGSTNLAALNSLNRMLSAIRPDPRVARSLGKIQVVAFTDPNDILSYRLTKDHVDQELATLVNVIVSNDWTYLPGIGKIGIQRPDTAHCDYRINPKVAAMVAVGNPGDGERTWRDVADDVEIIEESGCDRKRVIVTGAPGS